MIVLDASVAVEGLLRAGPARDAMFAEPAVAPHHIDPEVVQALRGQLRAGRISPGDATATLQRWDRFKLTRHTAEGLIGRAWELRDNLTAYDALYVALAEGLGFALVTADARLAGAPGLRCPVIVIPRG